MVERGRSGGLFVIAIGALILSAMTISLYSTLKDPAYGFPATGGFLAVVALYCRHRFVNGDEPLMLIVGTWVAMLALLVDGTALVFGLMAGLCC